MRTNVCKHCHESVGTTDPAVTTCGRCAGMTTGTRVKSPYGDGEILFPKHSGGFVVEIPGVGKRLFEGSQLTVIEAQPATAPQPVPRRESACDDQPAPVLTPTPDQDTAAALKRLEHEESIRLERTWRAGRLEIILRARSGGFGPQYVH